MGAAPGAMTTSKLATSLPSPAPTDVSSGGFGAVTWTTNRPEARPFRVASSSYQCAHTHRLSPSFAASQVFPAFGTRSVPSTTSRWTRFLAGTAATCPAETPRSASLTSSQKPVSPPVRVEGSLLDANSRYVPDAVNVASGATSHSILATPPDA